MTPSEMHNGNAIEYWYELHKRQSDWAFRAYGRLIQTLSEDVQEKLSLKDEAAQPYVVIFGKTQVGKTTLLLDLMGIAAEQMPIISEVMRGGREQGKSATATTMEYRASLGEYWGLTIPGESAPRLLDSDQEMKRALGQLREVMESGQLVAESPCVVHIPKRFFDTANSRATNVRILDLPGDNPANEQEQKHVNQMAKTYLPFADLILLVGRGDDLGFLKPEVITLPGIEDWQAMPHRFRIVTTYSYTAQSVKDILRNDDAADESLLRRRLIQEIERFGALNEAARDEALYFPLEFGNSWTGVQTTEPELHQRMSPIITRLRAELLNQISKATTPMGRLRSTLNTHHSVKYIQKKKTEVIETQIQELASKGRKIAQALVIWDKLVEQTGAQLSKIEAVLASQEVHDIAVAVGVDPASSDLSGLRYGKVCVLADADSDGAHIATLLCALFVRHFRPLVETGHVFVAMPPLYRIDVGKDVYYALDDGEKQGVLDRIAAEGRRGKVSVQRFKGLGEMSPMQLRETTMAPDTRRLLQLMVEPGDDTDSLMDMLLAKRRSADRRSWLETKGNLAEVL